jgi:hypothetical protein
MYLQDTREIRKLRIFYIDDPGQEKTDSELEEYRQSNVKDFWREASELCPNHPADRSEPCKNCLFEFAFFAYFPEALYGLLEGRTYDAYFVDIWPAPFDANRWDDERYGNKVGKHKEQIEKLLPDLPPGWHVNGKDHIIPLIAKLPHQIRPYVVWMSAVYKAREAMATENLSMVSGKETPIRWLLLGAYKWLRPQLLEKLTVPLPGEPDCSIHHPVLLDFNNKELRIATCVPIKKTGGEVLTDGLPAIPGGYIKYKFAPGLTRAAPLRHVVRGGRFLKWEKQILQLDFGRMIEAFGKKKEVRDRQNSEYPELTKIEEAIDEKLDTKTDAKHTTWNSNKGPGVLSTTDLAWRFLYHAVVRLYVYSESNGYDVSAFQNSRLEGDAKQFDSLGALATAQEFLTRALNLGGDEFARLSGDLELLWVPKVLSLAIDAELKPADFNFGKRARDLRKIPRNILGDILSETNTGNRLRRRILFSGWLRSDGVPRIQEVLFKIEHGKGNVRDLKSTLFDIYKNGKSMYEQFA